MTAQVTPLRIDLDRQIMDDEPSIMRISRIVVLLLFLVGIIAGAIWWRGRDPGQAVEIGAVQKQALLRSTVTASGEIVATRYADIGTDVMGKVVELPVAEGDRVTRGQVLARIDAVQARADSAAAAALVAALNEDAIAAAGVVTGARHDVDVATARARDADQQLVRKRQLAMQQLLAASDLDAAEATAAAARATLESARVAVERAQASLRAATQRVSQVKAQQARTEDVLRKTAIISPIAGIVSRLRVRQGEMVVMGIQNQPGTTLMTIADLSEVNAEVKVAESEVLRLRIGQAATVVLEALPGRRFSGRVVEIGSSALPLASAAAAAREFRIVVRLTDPDPGLKSGLTCDAEIVTSETPNAFTVPLQSVVLRPGDNGTERTGVFVVKDGRAVFTPVTTGPIGGVDIEVQGLAAGTPLVTGPFQALRTLTDGARIRNTASSR